MSELKSLVRSNGESDNIVCLHSCLGSSRQWCGLIDRLEDSFCLNAIDLYGYGKGPQWDLNKPFSLQDEIKPVAKLLDTLNGPIHLVGHSYGAAVALKVAEQFSHRVRSITVYEPVLFTLLFAAGQSYRSASEIFRVVEDMQQDYQVGNAAEATRRFIDYWSGDGAWNRFTPEVQASMSARVGMVLVNFEALLSEQNLFATLRDLDLPTLCLYGDESPATTIDIANILGELMPDISLQRLSGLGHMGPLTHGEIVNRHIERFIQSRSTAFNRPAFPEAA